MSDSRNFDQLPLEIKFEIYDFLKEHELMLLKLVSSSWKVPVDNYLTKKQRFFEENLNSKFKDHASEMTEGSTAKLLTVIMTKFKKMNILLHLKISSFDGSHLTDTKLDCLPIWLNTDKLVFDGKFFLIFKVNISNNDVLLVIERESLNNTYGKPFGYLLGYIPGSSKDYLQKSPEDFSKYQTEIILLCRYASGLYIKYSQAQQAFVSMFFGLCDRNLLRFETQNFILKREPIFTFDFSHLSNTYKKVVDELAERKIIYILENTQKFVILDFYKFSIACEFLANKYRRSIDFNKELRLSGKESIDQFLGLMTNVLSVINVSKNKEVLKRLVLRLENEYLDKLNSIQKSRVCIIMKEILEKVTNKRSVLYTKAKSILEHSDPSKSEEKELEEKTGYLLRKRKR